MGPFMNRRLPLRWANLWIVGSLYDGPIYIAPAFLGHIGMFFLLDIDIRTTPTSPSAEMNSPSTHRCESESSTMYGFVGRMIAITTTACRSMMLIWLRCKCCERSSREVDTMKRAKSWWKMSGGCGKIPVRYASYVGDLSEVSLHGALKNPLSM